MPLHATPMDARADLQSAESRPEWQTPANRYGQVTTALRSIVDLGLLIPTQAMPPRQSGSTGPVFLPSEWARRFKSNSLIADDGAALVTYPIPEAQIVDPHVGKTGAHRRCGT